MNDTDQSYENYRRSLRGKAYDSQAELRQALSNKPQEIYFQNKASKNLEFIENNEKSTEFSDMTYSGAASNLRNLLKPKTIVDDREILFSERGHNKYEYDKHQLLYEGYLPTSEEIVPILKNQSILLNQIEKENEYLKQQLRDIKYNVNSIVEENNLLNEELKSGMINLIMNNENQTTTTEYIEDNKTNIIKDDTYLANIKKNEFSAWNTELERLKNLYGVKTNRLEIELTHVKSELSDKLKELDAVKSDLRLKDVLNLSPDGIITGLCISCARNEAVLSGMTINSTKTLEKLTKDRDDLAGKLIEMQKKLNFSQSREQEAYNQVKKSIETVEECQLDRTRALVEREQLRQDLLDMQNRMEKHVSETIEKSTEDRKKMRQEISDEMNNLNSKLSESQTAFIKVQNELEKVCRDKIDLLVEFEKAKEELCKYGIDYGQATDSMKMTTTRSTIERNSAICEMNNLKKKLKQSIVEYERETSKLNAEKEILERRVSIAEKQLLDSKESSIEMMKKLQELERDAHGAKLAKEIIEKNRSDDLKTLSLQAQKREQELNTLLEFMESKSVKTTTEFEEIANSQRRLVDELSMECHSLTEKLMQSSKKSRKENAKLKSQNQFLRDRLNAAQSRIDEFEQQNHAHGMLHEKMRERIRQLDDHGDHTSTQLIQLLNQQKSLMRDRSLLVREVEFLRNQLLSDQKDDLLNFNKIYSTQYTKVDEIISSTKSNEIIIEKLETNSNISTNVEIDKADEST